MNYRKPFVILIILMLLGISGFSQNYERIISLAPSITKNITFLNSRDRLVGCTSFCGISSDEGISIIASAVKVNLEIIVSLEPDLVMCTGLTGSETIASLRNFGIKVEVFNSPKNFDELCDQFIYMGSLLDQQHLADSIINISRDRVEQLKIEEGTNPPDIFFQIGSKPIFTVLPNTYMDDFILFVGGRNIASELTKGTISREFVLKHDPDIIFIATMGLIGEEEKATWLSYKQMSASRTGQIILIDSDLACTPTPVTFVHTLEQLVKYMNNM